MTMYESFLRTEEVEFLKANMKTIEHVFEILERRETKEYYYERNAEKRRDKQKVLESMENVSSAIRRIVAEKFEEDYEEG